MSQLRSDADLAADAASGKRFALVVSRFHGELTDSLRGAAETTLADHGAHAHDIVTIRVPGAFELPMAADRMAASGRFDAVICLGVLIRGETAHFDVLAHATARAIQDVALITGTPVTFGVLTCDSRAQALARCGGEHGNKGVEAAVAAIEMAALPAPDEGD